MLPEPLAAKPTVMATCSGIAMKSASRVFQTAYRSSYDRTRMPTQDPLFTAALKEALTGLESGGIPIGSVLALDGRIVGRGHNQRIQCQNPVLHAEMDCLANAGRLSPSDYRRSTLYSTLSPCDMCSGAILLYKIPTVIVGENRTFRGPEEYLRSRGVNVTVLDDEECVRLMSDFIQRNPALWNEDIGEIRAVREVPARP